MVLDLAPHLIGGKGQGARVSAGASTRLKHCRITHHMTISTG